MTDWLTVLTGDCRDILPTLPERSVHCVVTSPPYWGLRDYGTASWDGGDPECDHVAHRGTAAVKTGLGYPADGGPRRVSDGNTYNEGAFTSQYRDTCGKCGARRIDRQLGLEPTPEEYVANMVAVFREVRRVLRDDGTVWLNLGDSYASSTKSDDRTPEERSRSSTLGPKRDGLGGGNAAHVSVSFGTRRMDPGLKPKDLVGIPWRVAFALQADGWYLRSDIIWSKPNPMPESVTDRPTKAHEYVFLLSKRERYYFDQEAVREPHAELDRPQSERRREMRMGRAVASVNGAGQSSKGIDDGWAEPSHVMRTNPSGRNIRSVWTIATQPYGSIGAGPGDTPDTTSPDCPVHSLREIRRRLRMDGDDGLLDHLRSRNRRSGSRPAPAPDDELRPSFRLDSSDDLRSTLGSAPLGSSPLPTGTSGPESRTQARPTADDALAATARTEFRTSHNQASPTSLASAAPSETDALVATRRNGHESRTNEPSGAPGSQAHGPASGIPDTDALLGSTCTCPDNSASHFAVFPEALVVPCVKAGCPEGGTVLDPFAGSGSVGKVANSLSRRAVLIELNPAYVEQIEKRTMDIPLGLTA